MSKGQHMEQSEVGRLERLWKRRRGPAWMFAAVESERLRDELIGRLDACRMDSRLQLPTNPKYLEGILAKAGAQRAHLVLPPGSWTPDAPWWKFVNAHRVSLAAAFPRPVIWWLPDACITTAARCARDSWNWRDAVFYF